MSEANYDAKARAEARRRRILEASQTRMNVVSGLPTSSSKTTPSTTTDATAEDDGEGQQTADTQLGEMEEMSPAQKIAQMRRRRYGKKTENSTATTEQQQEETLVDDEHNQKVTSNEMEADDINKQENMDDENMEQKDELESDEVVPQEEEESKDSSSKKYLGVAKMRRMKLAEKKAAEEAAFTRVPTASSSSAIPPETKARILASKQSVKTLPAVLQLVTVILLFLSGLDVGIQNHVVAKQNVPYLHENLSYQDHGIGAFVKFTQRQKEKNAFQEDTNRIVVEDYSHSDDAEFEEHYDTAKPAGASTASKVSNIDPIFGVDFDALTTGTGFFYTCARFAVSVHRTLYHFFYTVPMSILQSILSIPKKMFTHPPIMFLCAILIRFLGKHVLGGNIPDVKEMVEADENMDKAHAASTGTGAAAADNKMGGAVDKLASTNFMAMGGNYVKNYMKDSFPKATLAFTMFKDARADMLVVLCGFFVGLVLPVGVGVIGVKSNSDEL